MKNKNIHKAPLHERKHVADGAVLPQREAVDKRIKKQPALREIGGYEGRPEPTRYGDWEKKGRCIDF